MSDPHSPIEPLTTAHGEGAAMSQPAGSRTMMLIAVAGILAVGLCIALVYGVKKGLSKTVPFARGQAIAVGSHAFTFRDVESFTGPDGEKGLAVFFSFEGEPNISYLKVAVFFKSYFTLVDANGKKYDAVSAMSADSYRSQKGARGRGMANRDPLPQDWVTVFHVPPESRGFTLLFDHPTPRQGQADTYAAPLGR